jgi:methylenetetrahydrofolate reductase (NADPH)
MKIIDIYRRKWPVFSVEFFPPKNGEGLERIFQTFDGLKKFKLDYFSVTSGALGSQRAGTVAISALLKKKYGLEGLVHLTLTNKSKQEIENLLLEIKYSGLQNVLALRGDPERGSKKFIPHTRGFKYAYEMFEQIKQLNQGNYLTNKEGGFRQGLVNDFCVGVAGYPESHPECPDFKKSLEYLKIKVNSGADFIITQMFFDAEKFLKFREETRKFGINIPIIPGILPPSKYSEITFFSRQLWVSIPAKFQKKIEANKKDPISVKEICREYTILLVKKLLEEGVPGVHFFSLNRLAPTSEILTGLSYFPNPSEMSEFSNKVKLSVETSHFKQKWQKQSLK